MTHLTLFMRVPPSDRLFKIIRRTGEENSLLLPPGKDLAEESKGLLHDRERTGVCCETPCPTPKPPPAPSNAANASPHPSSGGCSGFSSTTWEPRPGPRGSSPTTSPATAGSPTPTPR